MAWRDWETPHAQPGMNKAAFPNKAVVLLWHAAALLEDPFGIPLFLLSLFGPCYCRMFTRNITW